MDYVLTIGDKSQFEFGFRGSFKTQITNYLVELFDEDSNSLIVNTDLTNLFNYRRRPYCSIPSI